MSFPDHDVNRKVVDIVENYLNRSPPTPYPVIIRHYPSLSVFIRLYPSLSVFIRRYPSLSVVIRRYPSLSVAIRPYPPSMGLTGPTAVSIFFHFETSVIHDLP